MLSDRACEKLSLPQPTASSLWSSSDLIGGATHTLFLLNNSLVTCQEDLVEKGMATPPLSRESHGQRSLAGYIESQSCKDWDTTEAT